jgi:hypothetical protein
MGGISVSIANLNADYEQIKSTFVDQVSKERKAQYLTGPAGGTGYTAKYGGNSYVLAKLVGSQAMSMGGAKTASNLTGSTHQWYLNCQRSSHVFHSSCRKCLRASL